MELWTANSTCSSNKTFLGVKEVNSTLYELVVVLATTLALSAAILGWTSVKQLDRKIVCTWSGRFGRVKMLYLGISAVGVFVIMVENLGAIYRLLGANREETIAYGLILGTVVLTVLLQAAIIRFSGKWHRLKLTEQLYREMKAAERGRTKASRPVTKTVQSPPVRRVPHSSSRCHGRGMFDQELGRTIYPDEEETMSRQTASTEDTYTSADDMQASAEAVSILAANALRKSVPPLDIKKIDVLLLAKSEDGTAQAVAELDDPAALPDPDRAYQDPNPQWTYQDYQSPDDPAKPAIRLVAND